MIMPQAGHYPEYALALVLKLALGAATGGRNVGVWLSKIYAALERAVPWLAPGPSGAKTIPLLFIQ